MPEPRLTAYDINAYVRTTLNPWLRLSTSYVTNLTGTYSTDKSFTRVLQRHDAADRIGEVPLYLCYCLK